MRNAVLSSKEDKSLDKLEFSILSSDIIESLLISLKEIELELKDEVLKYSGLLMLHFEILGIIKTELHPLKISFISILLSNFHFDIFGIKVNNEQSSKILFNLFILLVFHLEISGSSFNDEHP